MLPDWKRPSLWRWNRTTIPVERRRVALGRASADARRGPGRIVAIAALLLCGGWFGPTPVRAAERPNFVWLLSEDNSVHFLRLYGNPLGPTPRIESMAAQGIVFDHAFSCSPVCSVARTTLMSGIYAPRAGFQHHRKERLAELPAEARLFPAYLKQAGYYTTNNAKKDYNVVEGDVWHASSRKADWRGRSSPDTPFFHMQSFPVTHESSLHFPRSAMRIEDLVTPPDEVDVPPYHPDTPTFRFTHARYHDRMRALDEQIGRVIAQLEEDGLLEDTFVFYFGDHGGVLPRSKGYLYETGLHVPLVMRIPGNWRHLVAREPGTRSGGFVSFVDLGPTVLNLAGLDVPASMDGRPLLGPGVNRQEVEARDEAFGYADRFDEKYDLCRSLRKGRFKYIRNYQAFYPDALQNNYRYRMLAYDEWRRLHRQGKLDERQDAFFQAKAMESLYDLERDPLEVHNLAGDPRYAETLRDMRARLRERVKGLPDLSFYPESFLVEQALPGGVAFGKAHARQIGRLVDVADLALRPFQAAQGPLASALGSADPWQRYWGLIACSCFGEQAREFVPTARRLLSDREPLVRVRAAEFLALLAAADPGPTLRDVLATSDSSLEALLTLNTIVFLRDHEGVQFDPNSLEVKSKSPLVQRRLDYLRGNLPE